MRLGDRLAPGTKDDDEAKREVDQFLLAEIDSVPHLEALLLLWNNRPRRWSAAEMAKALFVPAGAAQEILEDLARRHLIVSIESASGPYAYDPDSGRDRLLESLDMIYRRELIRISRLIHSKPPAAIREFARAFRLKKERE